MSLKTSVKYIQSGELSSPASVISGSNLALGNIQSSVPSILPSTSSFDGLINGPLTMTPGAVNGGSGLGGITSVTNIKELAGGGIGGAVGGIGNINDIIGSYPV